MTIAAILEYKDHEVISVPADMAVREVVALLSGRRIGAVPVTRDGVVVGILSERDLIRGLAEEGALLLDRVASDVMTSPVVTVEPDIHPIEALSLMTRRRIRHLPVMDHGRMIGFVSIGDLVKARIQAIEREADAMRAYIQAV